jgi:hypothetical protein
MNIQVAMFRTNNPGLKVSDVITSISAGEQLNGIISINIKTAEKYVDIDPVGSSVGPGAKGQVIEIRPLISGPTGFLLADDDFGAYLKHPDYYCIQLLVCTNSLEYTSVVTPLKHEYTVNYIPYEIVFNKACLQQITLEHNSAEL